MNLDNYFCLFFEIWNGGFSFFLMVFLILKKGFFLYISVYNVIFRDYIFNFGFLYLKINLSVLLVY